MFEIHVTVSCPDLVAAAQLLAKGAQAKTAGSNEITAPAPVMSAAPTAPTTPVPTLGRPSPAAPVIPATPALSVPVAPGVPLASAPTFTIQQIAKAGADLFTARPELQPQVNALLTSYGIHSVTDLRPEHYGAFATALRELGAAI
ncbi:MAG: hypothetical protein J6C98_05805 [Oscillospiraceae bacterium]|nr:hypothetical protein [Oscillospiraceae bacterium]